MDPLQPDTRLVMNVAPPPHRSQQATGLVLSAQQPANVAGAAGRGAFMHGAASAWRAPVPASAADAAAAEWRHRPRPAAVPEQRPVVVAPPALPAAPPAFAKAPLPVPVGMATPPPGYRSFIWDLGEKYRRGGYDTSDSSSVASSARAPRVHSKPRTGRDRGSSRPWETAAARARQFLGESEALLPHRRGMGAMEQSLMGGSTQWTPESSKCSASWATLVVTVFADIAPCNVLALSQPPGGLAPMIAFLAVFGGVSLCTTRLVSFTMVFSGKNTLAEVWRDTIGSQTAWIPNVSVLLTCFACCVGLMTFYGSLFADAFGTTAENMWVVVLSLFPVSVMVMAKDISSMWFTSMIAGLSAILTMLIVVYRACDGSYEPGGHFQQLSRAEAFNQPHSVGEQPHMFQQWSRGSFQMIVVMSVMFLSHYNSAKYYRELSQQGREWYTRGVAVAMACSAVTVLMSATAVSRTFRDVDPLKTNLIVDLYHLDDMLVNFARIALAFGLMGSLTLMFSAMREAFVELISEQIPTGAYIFSTVVFQNTFSLGLLALLVAITCSSTKGMNLTLFHVGRSAVGAIVIYVIPGVLFLQSLRKYNSETSVRCETRCLVAAVMIFGVALAVCGFVVHFDPTFN